MNENGFAPGSLCLWVVLFFLGIYLLTAGVGFYSTDGETMVRTTWAIIDKHRLSVPCDPGQPSAVAGRDGRCYSRYGLGQPQAVTPLYLAGKGIAALIPGLDYGETIRFAVSRFNQIVTALLCGMVCALAARLYRSRRSGLVVALSFGLATLALPYARFYFNEPLTALALLLSVYELVVFNLEGRGGALLWGGLAFGFAALTRTTVLVLLPLLLAYLWWVTADKADPRAHSFRLAVSFVGPVVALTLIQVAYQAWAFGPLQLLGGYEGEGWTTPLWQGVQGLLLSPGKSLVLFVPLALLAPWGLARLAADGRRREASLFAAISLVWLLVHACWWTWHGGWSWGPRFLMPIVPFLIVPLGALWAGARRSVRTLIVALAVLGFMVELGGVMINFGDYMMLINDEDKILFSAAYSPVWGHWRMLLAGAMPDLAWWRFPAIVQVAWVGLAGGLALAGLWGARGSANDRV
jgi:hypothetical protein